MFISIWINGVQKSVLRYKVYQTAQSLKSNGKGKPSRVFCSGIMRWFVSCDAINLIQTRILPAHKDFPSQSLDSTLETTLSLLDYSVLQLAGTNVQISRLTVLPLEVQSTYWSSHLWWPAWGLGGPFYRLVDFLWLSHWGISSNLTVTSGQFLHSESFTS